MAPLESFFFWITLFAYSIAAGGYLYAILWKHERILQRLIYLTGGGLVSHTAVIVTRTVAQGHLPWAGDYENSLMAGWFVMAFTVGAVLRRRTLESLPVGTLPFTVLLMGFGFMRNPVLGPVAASLKSFWLYIHVYFAWLAFGAFALALGAGVLYLLKERDARRGGRDTVYERFPSLDRLDELTFRFLVFGFIMDAVMIASGAIWGKDLWGSYWNWDPVETWSLVSWLVYGVIIHLRVTLGWRGRRLAWLAIAAMTGVVISFFGVTFVVESSLHIFNVR
jgi:cytochrome c-type biogenesis protein CcsB